MKKTSPNQSVCLLLITRGSKVMVEPCKSSNFEGNIIRALSHKFIHEKTEDVGKALKDLVKKYQLSGVYNKTEKVEMVKIFSINNKTFHVHVIVDEDKPIRIDGNFCFINKQELLNNNKVLIRGTGECLITESLKIALS